MKKLALLLVATAALAVVGGAVSTGAARGEDASGGIVVPFQKHIVDPANFGFQGTTGGPASGTLVSMIVGPLDASSPVWHFTFKWVVTADNTHKSFVALTDGSLDTTTGSVVMDGSVVQGWHLGARVHEEGQLVDPATLTFAGNILILPGQGND